MSRSNCFIYLHDRFRYSLSIKLNHLWFHLLLGIIIIYSITIICLFWVDFDHRDKLLTNYLHFCQFLRDYLFSKQIPKQDTVSWSYFPAGIYLLKVNDRNTRTKCEICSKLTIKTPVRRQLRLSGCFYC